MIESFTQTQWSEIRLVTCNLVLGAALGLGGCAGNEAVPSKLVAVQPSAADEELAGIVREALHADRYLYDKHVEVSIERGDVVLRGFVSSYDDMLSAKRIASKAAGGRRIVNYLSIKPTPEQNSGPRH